MGGLLLYEYAVDMVLKIIIIFRRKISGGY